MQTRYILFYADEIVQQGILTKSEVQYRTILGFNDTGQLTPQITLDEEFKQTLRQENGYFFDLDVRPSSPRKRHKYSGTIVCPFSDWECADPNNLRGGEKICAQGPSIDQEFRSPTFKCDSDDKASSVHRSISKQGNSRKQMMDLIDEE